MEEQNKKIYEAAKSYIGLQEYPGAKNNPEITKMFSDSGHAWVKADSTPWCAAFVGSVLGSVGLEGTKKLNARSYIDWGEKVATEAAEVGDIIVFWRGSPKSETGHVGFFAGWADSGNPLVLGGNQGDKVSIIEYPAGRILAVRRAKIRTSKLQSKIVVGSAAATGGITGSVAVDQVAQAIGEAQGSIQSLIPYMESLKYVFVGMALMGAILSLYARLRDWDRGRR